MAIIIAFGIFIISAIALFYIVGRKVSYILSVPRNNGKSVADIKKSATTWVQEQRATQYVRTPELGLLRLLSFVRITLLRAETTTGKLLERLRKHSQKKSGRNNPESNDQPLFSENYWKRVKGDKRRV